MAPGVSSKWPTTNVVDFLIDQHGEIRRLMEQVRESSPSRRQEVFDAARELLARHETAEAMVIRPMTRKVPHGRDIAGRRMSEENEAKQALADLESMDVETNSFMSAFNAFRDAVLEHAAAEEAEEFPALRASISRSQLISAYGALERAEETAPSHPHPSARTTAMNYLAGPIAAMVDRARDARSRRSR